MYTTQTNDFASSFKRLTDKPPLLLQTRLFSEYFAKNELCSVLDLPTGLGKTMVMAIWLIARSTNCKLPRRLIYVVDRRTVVDQATDLAEKLRANFGEDKLAISTLRGQLADNREWSRDPTKPAIIIGTVDLIGSALLFSGYRSSYKRRPLEAGLLGQDSLLVLDEAHLSKPFEKLIRSISEFQKHHGSPMRVIRMSATSDATNQDKNTVFRLDTDPNSKTFDLSSELDENGDEKNPVKKRFEAKKRLSIITLGEKDKLVDKLAQAAIDLVEQKPAVGQRIVVFTRKPDDARSIADAIRKHGAKKNSPGPYAESVQVLTGTMRGLERDELVEKPVFKERWLNGDIKPDDQANQSPVFLISTSAGEVGFDLNADHLVGDEAPMDSWIQRLGRVNRRGGGDATIILIKEANAADKTEFDKACSVASGLFRDGMDVSPNALAEFKKSLTAEQIQKASSPTPTMVEVTDILLDAWSMTSISEPMPGRPKVGPWLRGIADELPQTTIVWRAELELLDGHPHPVKALESIFSKHPIRSHESITTYSYRVAEFLKKACKLKDRPDLPNTRVSLRLSRGKIVTRTIRELADEPGILYAEPTLILPATFGGLDAAGMLDAQAIPKSRRPDEPPPPSLDVADHPGYEQRDGASPRLRLVISRTEDGEWRPESLAGGVVFSQRLQLDDNYPSSTALFADLRKNDLRVRLVQPIELDDEGDAIRLLVTLSAVSNKNKPEDQTLDDHVRAVEKEARRIANELGMAEADPFRIALVFAAQWHDEGKKADIWQRFVYGPYANGQFKGKSSRSRDPKSLRGYRHECGSLLRIHYPNRCGTTGCAVPTDSVARDLALHLIATHHGAARPHFQHAVYAPFSDAERDSIHTEIIRRFARLQRKYGWWRLAWLENLLRCADALASADIESEDDPLGVEGDEA